MTHDAGEAEERKKSNRQLSKKSQTKRKKKVIDFTCTFKYFN